jgi:translation initiation factor IF-3
MAHPEIGERWVKKMCDDLAEIAIVEAPAKLMGRSLSCVLAPGPKKSTKGKPVEAGPKETTSA